MKYNSNFAKKNMYNLKRKQCKNKNSLKSTLPDFYHSKKKENNQKVKATKENGMNWLRNWREKVLSTVFSEELK